MGCDIHLTVEKLVDGKWVDQSAWKTEHQGTPDEYTTQVRYDQWYGGRNYALFALLADVRNYHNFKPLADPRGIPANASREYREWATRWGGDGHSHSYLTLKELLDFDWTQETTHKAQTEFAEFVRWSAYLRPRGNGPEMYAAMIGGKAITYCSMAEADAMVKTLIQQGAAQNIHELAHVLSGEEAQSSADFRNMVVNIEWQEAYYLSASDFLGLTVPKLLALAKGDHESVRICFFFDN